MVTVPFSVMRATFKSIQLWHAKRHFDEGRH
jgi:hypothetical protein